MKKLIDKWFKKVKENKTEGKHTDLPYTALSPIADADIEDDYRKALDWALKNRIEFDIKNIALTGPYGSGKSSILKTYITTCTDNDLHFLPISLATFKEEESKDSEPQKEDLLRQIELSILQQIFYREEDSSIPDSRFRKIKNYTKKDLRNSTIVLCVFFFSLFNLIYPELLERLLKTKFPTWLTYALRYFSFLMSVVGLIVIIYKSIRIFSGIKLSKLNIQNAEIEISEKVNKSILNHHIDEIIYFFEVTDYNVVIIEDLDRFKQTEIFTKLREINLLLNSSKKIKRSIVFIYAVRDDMFKDQNERTKFFDFVIPVIPVINPSNSSQKLLERKELTEFGISENLIDTVSLFIDDMRLLHNIVNEFYLYHQKLNKGLNQDRLLGIVVYKNMFPKDFTLLSKNEGDLYHAIHNKQQYISIETKKLDERINAAKENIKLLENLKIRDIKELRYMYLPFFIYDLPGFKSFHIDGTDVTLDQMVTDKNFDTLISAKAQYRFISYHYGERIGNIATLLSTLEENVDNRYTYTERKKQIEDWNSNRVEALKHEIQQLELEKSRIRNLKVEEVLAKSHLEINISDEKQKRLVATLLRNGFINEDYLDYVSLFYEGSITKEDHQFLINVKSQTATDFKHKLRKISRLIPKINENEFDKEYILNYSLIDEIFASSSYQNIRNKILLKLKDESDVSIKFVEGYLDSGYNVASFIWHLTKVWTNIWTFLETKSNFSSERKQLYFKLIIENADITDIRRLYESNYFKSYLLQQRDFLSIIPQIGRLKEIIKTLDIKFTDLDVSETPKDFLQYVLNGNYYTINIQMIKEMLSLSGSFNETEFDTKNYSAVLNSGSDILNEYVHENINDYVKNVYLKLSDNIQEEEEALSDLLNNDDLIRENKLSIIKQVKTKIGDLSIINDLEVHELLLEESKVIPVWDNLYQYYQGNEKQLSDSIVIFIEQSQNGIALSQTKIKKDITGERKYTDFILKLITNNKFSDTAYENIIKSVPYSFLSLSVSTLSRSKVLILLRYPVFVFNTENYNAIKEAFPGLHIQLLENNKSKFLSTISDYEVDSNDVLLILQSTIFTLSEKNQVIEKVSEDLITSNDDSIKKLGELILQSNSFRINDSILKLILQNGDLSIEQRIRVHNWKYTQLSVEDYNIFLNSLGEPYSEIAILGKRPLLKNNEYNLKLVDVLDSKNYISKYDIEDKGIRISTFRKSNES
jgi:hypothetical protein